MTQFLLRRVAIMVPTLFLISLVSFVIIQLPPGDYLTTYVARLSSAGETVQPEQLTALRMRYALDEPMPVQYWRWLTNIVLRGDFGHSFEYGRSVTSLLGERLPLTITIGVVTMLFTWAVALPFGVYSAVRKYSVGDYAITGLVFIGLGIPNFLLALTVAYLQLKYFHRSVGGLFSPEFADAPWNLGKLLDLLDHVWLPIVIIAWGNIAGVVRIMRANLLDELHKPYVVTARSRGLRERDVIARFPVRVALNPFVSTIGWVLPSMIAGEIIVAKVLGLETTGPLLLKALQGQDMYLAGSLIFVLSVLTVLGTLLSDVLLGIVDPRIRATTGAT